MIHILESLFLEYIIYSTLAGSFVVLILTFLRQIFSSKLDHEWRYCSWFLLLYKLIIPFSLLGGINIINYMLPAFRNLDQTAVAELDSRLLTVNEQFNLEKFYPENISGVQLLNFIDTVAILWCLGVTVQLGIAMLGSIRFQRNIRRCIVETEPQLLKMVDDLKRKVELRRKVTIVVMNEIEMPATYGVFKLRVILPENLLDRVAGNQLEYILIHELVHLKRRDQMMNLIFRFIKILHWFNPLIYYAFRKMRQDCELSCDEKVLSYMEEMEALDYGKTLVVMLESIGRAQTLAGVPCLVNKKLIPIEKRLRNIMDFHSRVRSKSRWVHVFSWSAIIMILVAPIAVNAKVLLSSDSLQGSMEWPLENHYAITSVYGVQEKKQESFHQDSFHTGIDIQAEVGADISAAYQGIVAFSGWDDDFGKVIIIEHSNDLISIYAHCSELFVQKGTQVSTGEVIAASGNSGYSSAPHLHFEIRRNGVPADPHIYLNK